MARTDGAEETKATSQAARGRSRLPLWIAAAALIIVGIALFFIAFYRQGLFDALFYLIVVAMGLYLLTIPWRNRRVQAKTGSSSEV